MTTEARNNTRTAGKRTPRQDAELQLPKPIPPIPTSKLQSTLPTALIADVELYRKCYQDENNAEISWDTLMAHILRQHLRRDKKFAQWRESNRHHLNEE